MILRLACSTIALPIVLSPVKELLLLALLSRVLLSNLHVTVSLTYPNYLEEITWGGR